MQLSSGPYNLREKNTLAFGNTPELDMKGHTLAFEFSESRLRSQTEIVKTQPQSSSLLLASSGTDPGINDYDDQNYRTDGGILTPFEASPMFYFDHAKLEQYLQVLNTAYPASAAASTTDDFCAEFVFEKDQPDETDMDDCSEKHQQETPYIVQIIKMVAEQLNSSLILKKAHRRAKKDSLFEVASMIVMALAEVEEEIKLKTGQLYGEGLFNTKIQVSQSQFAPLGLHWFGWIISESSSERPGQNLEFHQRVCVLALQRLVKLACFGQAIAFIDNLCSLVFKKVMAERELQGDLHRRESIREYLKEYVLFSGIEALKKRMFQASWQNLKAKMKENRIFSRQAPACFFLEQYIMEVEAADYADFRVIKADLGRVGFLGKAQQSKADRFLRAYWEIKEKEEAIVIRTAVDTFLGSEPSSIEELDRHHLSSAQGRSIKKLLALLACSSASRAHSELTLSTLMDYADLDKEIEPQVQSEIWRQLQDELRKPNTFMDEQTGSVYIWTLPPAHQVALYLADIYRFLFLGDRIVNRALGHKIISDLARVLIPIDIQRRAQLSSLDHVFTQQRQFQPWPGMSSDFCQRAVFSHDQTSLSQKLEDLSKEAVPLERTLFNINQRFFNYSYGEDDLQNLGPSVKIANKVRKIVFSLQQQRGQIPKTFLEKVSAPSSGLAAAHVYLVVPGPRPRSEAESDDTRVNQLIKYLTLADFEKPAVFSLAWIRADQAREKNSGGLFDSQGAFGIAKAAFEGAKARVRRDEISDEAIKQAAKEAGKILACCIAIRHPFKFQSLSILALDMGSVVVTSCLETLHDIYKDVLGPQEEVFDQILDLTMIRGPVPTNDLDRWAKIKGRTVVGQWKRVFFKRMFPKQEPSSLELNLPGVENLNLANMKVDGQSPGDPTSFGQLLRHIKFE